MSTELYRHTQPGTLMRAIFGGIVLADIAVLLFFCCGRSDLVGLGMSGLMLAVFLVCLLLFHSLTVAVGEQTIEVRFGPGLIRRTYPTGEVVSCAIVCNSFWYGWGIHKIRGGWVYNVSGFDAVEITLKDGRIARIGTDEPQELAAAINKLLRADKRTGPAA